MASMKPFTATRLSTISTVLAALPATVSAHPGHDGGHDLTWDFAGEFGHVQSILGLLLALGLTIAVVKILRSRTTH
jgi:hypothetical protein